MCDFAIHNGGHRIIFRIKNTCGAGDDRILQAGDFGNSAFWRQIAFQDREVALFVHWVLN